MFEKKSSELYNIGLVRMKYNVMIWKLVIIINFNYS